MVDYTIRQRAQKSGVSHQTLLNEVGGVWARDYETAYYLTSAGNEGNTNFNTFQCVDSHLQDMRLRCKANSHFSSLNEHLQSCKE